MLYSSSGILGVIQMRIPYVLQFSESDFLLAQISSACVRVYTAASRCRRKRNETKESSISTVYQAVITCVIVRLCILANQVPAKNVRMRLPKSMNGMRARLFASRTPVKTPATMVA